MRKYKDDMTVGCRNKRSSVQSSGQSSVHSSVQSNVE